MDATLKSQKWKNLLGEVHGENKVQYRQEEVRVTRTKRLRTERILRQTGQVSMCITSSRQISGPRLPKRSQDPSVRRCLGLWG